MTSYLSLIVSTFGSSSSSRVMRTHLSTRVGRMEVEAVEIDVELEAFELGELAQELRVGHPCLRYDRAAHARCLRCAAAKDRSRFPRRSSLRRRIVSPLRTSA